MSDSAGILQEREWTDKLGEHYEASIVCAHGRVVSEHITKFPYLGWDDAKEKAAERVRQMALNKSKSNA